MRGWIAKAAFCPLAWAYIIYLPVRGFARPQPGRKEGKAVQKYRKRPVEVEATYVIRGVMGEHYACRTDVFHGTYEEVSGE